MGSIMRGVSLLFIKYNPILLFLCYRCLMHVGAIRLGDLWSQGLNI